MTYCNAIHEYMYLQCFTEFAKLQIRLCLNPFFIPDLK